jgi:ribosomal-protein-alanine N-acetyltransferase
MEIKTASLLLRGFVDSDKQKVFEGLSHPDVIPYYGVSYPTVEATQVQMDWFASLEREGTGMWWAVCSPDNTIFYGAGGLNSLSEQHRKAEIGFWLLPEFWGQGIMKEAIPAIVKYGFEELNLHRIEGFVESKNENCKRVLPKLGFRHEGCMVDCEIKHGKYISLDIYAVLKR